MGIRKWKDDKVRGWEEGKRKDTGVREGGLGGPRVDRRMWPLLRSIIIMGKVRQLEGGMGRGHT